MSTASTDPNGLHRLFQGPRGAARVEATRRRLERALETWWRQGEFPSLGLLRDGLLLLEAGHPLDDATRSLLLRAALFHGRGMLTALRHQADGERIALILRDMLLDAHRPLPPAQVRELWDRDPQAERWRDPLVRLLREAAREPLEPRRTLAAAALLYLEEEGPADLPRGWVPPAHTRRASSTRTPSPGGRPSRPRRGHGPRLLAAAFFLASIGLVLLAGILFVQAARSWAEAPLGMVPVPQGVYRVGDPADGERRIRLGAFEIDRTEVTVGAYRRCVQAGVCPFPERTTSLTRPDYFLNPAFDGYPMVNVTWDQADLFCAWAGKRLPLEEEWEVAGGAAWTLDKRYRYPWGDRWDPSRANSREYPAGDTLPVASFSPAGDSPAGAADMAGNVAEWTATPGDPTGDPPPTFVVKGGSFLDGPDALTVTARRLVPRSSVEPWLGFRCARTLGE